MNIPESGVKRGGKTMKKKPKSKQLAYLLLSSLLLSGTTSADRITAGSAHNVVIRGDSYVYAWGANESGQLGDGSTLDALNPLNVVDSRYQAINGGVAVTSYGNNNIVLMDDGTLLGWGDNTSGQLGSGVLYSSLYKPFGDKNGGEDPETDLDAGDDEDIDEPTNAAIEFPAEVVDPAGVPIANVVTIATGSSFSAAIRQDTTVIVWGDLSAFEDVEEERYGSEPYRDKYFDPDAEIIDSPYLYDDPAEKAELLVMRDAAGNPVTGIMDIAVGDDYLLALTDQGFVLAWGDNSTGQLADGTYASRSYPVFVQNTVRQPISRITSVVANGNVSMAVRADGFVLGWGGAAIAVPLDETDQQALPLADYVRDGLGIKVSGVRRLALGVSHTLAIKFNNTVFGWGSNSNGQLGDGTNATVEGITTVVTSEGKALSNVYEIAVGDSHSLAVRADGQVFAWGLGDNGRLGDGTNIDSYYAVKVRDRNNLPFSLY